MYKKLLSIHKLVFFFTSTVLLAVFLSGCSQIASQKTELPKETEATKDLLTKKTIPYMPNMTAEMMYNMLLAEMLIIRNQPLLAFKLLYPLAVEIRDPALAERSFQLAMQTRNVRFIQASTSLWLDLSPNDPRPWQASYLLALKEGNINKAKEHWQKHVALSEHSLEKIFIKTSLRIVRAVPKGTNLRFLGVLLQENPTNPAAFFALGSVAEEYGKCALAIPKLENAVKIYSQMNSKELTNIDAQIQKESYYALARCYLRVDSSQQNFNKIAHRVAQTPKDWTLQEYFARLEIKAGLLSNAEKRYQLIIENNPNSLTARLALALLQLDREDFTNADINFTTLQQDASYFAIASYYLGISAQHQGLFKKAIEYFSQITTADYYIDAQLRILEINFVDNGLEKTIAKINMLEATTKNNQIKLHRASAMFYLSENKLIPAKNSYQYALELNPNNVNILMLQAQVFYDLEKFTHFQKNILKVIKLEPNNANALNALGFYFVEHTNKLDEATILLEKAHKLNPNSFYIIDSLGWLAYKKHEFEKAEELLEKAFDMQKDAEVLVHLMRVKIQLNKQDEAIALGNKYKNKFTDNLDIKYLLKKIQQ